MGLAKSHASDRTPAKGKLKCLVLNHVNYVSVNITFITDISFWFNSVRQVNCRVHRRRKMMARMEEILSFITAVMIVVLLKDRVSIFFLLQSRNFILTAALILEILIFM